MNFFQRKRKGIWLQKVVANLVLKHFPSLTKQDVVSTPPCVNGADVTLSDKGKETFPYKVEAKNHERMKALWDYFLQAELHDGEDLEPLLVVKRRLKPELAVIHLEHFIKLVSIIHHLKKGKHNDKQSHQN